MNLITSGCHDGNSSTPMGSYKQSGWIGGWVDEWDCVGIIYFGLRSPLVH